MRTRVVLIVLGVVVAGSVGVYSLRPVPSPAVDFTDGLTGPTSAQFSIPFDKYTLTPEGLLRSRSNSGRTNGVDRPVVRTLSDRYIDRDFVFEVDVTIPEDVEDLVYVGLGDTGSAPPFHEPSGVFGFRVHHLGTNREVRLAAHALATASAAGIDVVEETVGTFPDSGTLTVRLERSGDRITASLPEQPGSERTMSIAAHPSVLKSGRGFLYLSNTAEGTTFSNVRVRPRS